MKIISLDTRENNNKFITFLADISKGKGYDLHMETLSFGDIQCGNIIIERKEINDFYSSITSDRMWEQIAHMKANNEYVSIIMISGRLQDLREVDDIKVNVIMGALKKITALGIPHVWVQNDNELVFKALEFFSYAESNEDFVPIKRVEKNKKDSLFMALPHVGRKAAKKLIKEFDNIETLVHASEKEIQAVVGPKKGSDIFKALRQ
jgi:ERCC4-type nuclease